MGQGLPSQRQQGRGGIQLAADRLGDSQPCPNPLGSLVEVLNGDRLIEILAQKDGQIVLGQADQALLPLEAGSESIRSHPQIREAGIIRDGERNLGGEDFQRFDGCPVWTQTISGGIHAQQAQGHALIVLQRDDQKIIWVPGGVGGSRAARLLDADHVYICRDNRCVIHRDEIGATDLELWLEHLLDARQRLLSCHQFGQRFRRKSDACYASQQSAFWLINADQNCLERRCFTNAFGNRSE